VRAGLDAAAHSAQSGVETMMSLFFNVLATLIFASIPVTALLYIVYQTTAQWQPKGDADEQFIRLIRSAK
jgi:hypothetical protein